MDNYADGTSNLVVDVCNKKNYAVTDSYTGGSGSLVVDVCSKTPVLLQTTQMAPIAWQGTCPSCKPR